MSEITHNNDEIDLKDLFRAIIRTRVAVVAALLLVCTAFWTAL